MFDGIIDLYHDDALTENGFHEMASGGIAAVIHKATDGTTGVDPLFIGRRTRAQSVGLLWGAYHFLQADAGAAQAKHFVNVAGADVAGQLLVMDWEVPPGKPAADWRTALAFALAVKAAAGRMPILYSGDAFLREHAAEIAGCALSECPLWVARYGPEPVTRGWVMWQYTDGASGAEPRTAPGVVKACDRSRFAGTEEELRAAWPALGAKTEC